MTTPADRTESRFRSLIEKALDIVSIIDADGRYVYTSPSFEAAVGYSNEDTQGMDAFLLVHPDDREGLYAAFQRGVVAGEGATAILEYRHRHKDGTWRVVESVGHNLLDDPAVRGIVVVSRDVTERRALEEQLQSTLRLEAVGQLAGGIAHDFNNVLLVVRGYAALLQERLGDSPEARYAAEIVEASDRAAGMTRQLLAFGRRQTLQPTVLDVNDAVRGAETLLRRLLPEEYTLDLRTASSPAVVVADVGQIEQVLVNLASNARDAMPDGGTVGITVRVEQLGDDAETKPQLRAGRYVTISVADTGTGIPPEALAHVFEPFFTTKPQGEGTGLGLATVYGVAAQSGGAIGVETGSGGTTFSVYLPAAVGEARDETPGDARGSERVLLVEDDPQARDLVGAILRDRGYDVAVAGGPSEAVEAARSDRFDLVISDVVMPEMSGYELVQTLRGEQPEVRSLFISGYAHGVRNVGGELEAGVLLLQKPFAAHELAGAVRKVLDT